MREKINRLAEGNYEYEQSRVIVTPEVLDWNHVTKQVYQTSLVISNEKRHLMKGIVTTHAPENHDRSGQFSWRGQYDRCIGRHGAGETRREF